MGIVGYFNYPSFKNFFLTDQADIERIIAERHEFAQNLISELDVLALFLPEADKSRIRVVLKGGQEGVFPMENSAIKNILKGKFALESTEDGTFLRLLKFDKDIFISDFAKKLNELARNLDRIGSIEISEDKQSLIFKMVTNKRLALESPPIDTIFKDNKYDWLYDANSSQYQARVANPPNLLSLGLDLKGGIYLDVGIDQDKAVQEFLERKQVVLENTLFDLDIGVKEATSNNKDGITIILKNQADQEGIAEAIGGLIDGLDLIEEGAKLQLKVKDSYEQSIQEDSLRQAMEIIRSRIDLLGVKEPIIQKRGKDAIVVQIPGETDSLRIKELITKPANLEFRIVLDETGGNTATGSSAGDGEILYTEKLDDKTKEVIETQAILVSKEVALGGDMIADARVVFDQMSGAPQVSMDMKPAGAKIFAEITRNNVGRSLAIVLDKKVRSYPRINQAIYGGQASISGSFSVDEARDLAIVLRSGALPVKLIINEERVVGASLGEESIAKSFYALVVGFSILAVLIMIYYALSGLLAIIGLWINLLMLLAVLAFFGATLTLPGIAGIILTIGMAVDANVLIFERIREELKHGAMPRRAIQQGFNRVAVTILDANITTLMVAAVLFQFGTGPIRGFAVTLAIGICTTIITSLGISRWFYDIVYLRKHNLKRISI